MTLYIAVKLIGLVTLKYNFAHMTFWIALIVKNLDGFQAN